jgi:hypothetical protein
LRAFLRERHRFGEEAARRLRKGGAQPSDVLVRNREKSAGHGRHHSKLFPNTIGFSMTATERRVLAMSTTAAPTPLHGPVACSVDHE